MVRAHLILGFLSASAAAWAQQYVISTMAGGVPPATPISAVQASIGDPPRVAADGSGNVYFGSLHSVFKVDRGGTLTRIAGTGRSGNSGDGGPATSAQLAYPNGIAVDAAGNLYVADRDANVIRKISAGGTIGTIASGAQLNQPFGIALDSAGSLYIADTNNNRICKVSGNGSITTIAGDGALSGPEGVAVDASGSLYIADMLNHRIQKVAPDGTITTVAGTSGLFLPTDVAVDRAGNLYIADFGNSRVRMVANGVSTTVAGSPSGALLSDGAGAVSVRLSGPTGVAVDSNGNVYFAEGSIGSGSGLAGGDFRIWKVSAGILTALAGNGVPSYSGDGGPAAAAQLNAPAGLALDSEGNLYFADSLNHRVRQVSPDGTITTVVGDGIQGFAGDFGLPAGARLHTPEGLAVDAAGNLYIADTLNSRVRKLEPGGNIFTVAGNGNLGYFGDGLPANRAALNQPRGVALDSAGNLYIADTLNHAVRKVATDGTISSIAGTSNPGFSGDGGAATGARLDRPGGVAVDAVGNVYIADTGNGRIRKVDRSGIITTVAGDDAQLSDPRGVAVDRAGNVYIADSGHSQVRKVSPDGAITIAGNGSCCYSGDGGLGTNAQLNLPWGLAVDPAGDVYVADSGNHAIRLLLPVSSALSISSVTNGASNLAGPIAPGEIVTVYGSGLAGASVLFNGTPGPILYAYPTQVAAVVSYGVSGASVQVVAQHQNLTTVPTTLPLASSAPALFTQDGSGKGQAVAINQDGSINGAAHPAPAGSFVTLYATGEGQTSPAGIDGKMADVPLPRPLLPVSVTIGGQAANVQFAGGAPGFIAGVMQVSAQIPGGDQGGSAIPVVLQVGGVKSPAGVTIVVNQ